MYQKKQIFKDPIAYILNNNIENESINKTPDSNIFKSDKIINNLDFNQNNDYEYYSNLLENIFWNKYE